MTNVAEMRMPGDKIDLFTGWVDYTDHPPQGTREVKGTHPAPLLLCLLLPYCGPRPDTDL